MLNNFKWYRRLIGGVWYKISYNYKRDGGMTKVFEEEWVNGDISYYKQFNNFTIIETEDYE